MKPGKKRGFFYELKKNKVLYLMFLPVAIYFIVFAYLPMPGIIVAFKDFNYAQGIFGSPWNGFENFRYFFASGKAFQVTRNTIVYNLVFLAANTIVSLVVGVLLAEMLGKRFKKVSQTMIFLPYFISWVTVSSFVSNLFGSQNGLMNKLFQSLGFEGFNIYASAEAWYILLPILYVWKGVGYSSVLYLSSIMGIDQECYESARIDGANVFQRIWYITLPLLKPTIITLLLLGVSRIMRGEFDMFYQLIGNNGLLYDKTDIIDTLVFRSLLGSSDFGMASAGGFYQSVLCFIIIMGTNGIVKRVSSEHALF